MNWRSELGSENSCQNSGGEFPIPYVNVKWYNTPNMTKRVFLTSFAASALLLAGCATISRAHETQRAVAPRGNDAAQSAASARIALCGSSLAELVDFALTNRPSVAVSRLAVRDARLKLRELAADAPLLENWSDPLASVRLALSGGYSASGEPFSLSEKLDFDTRGSASAALSLDLLLWDWGCYDAAAKAQAERVIAAEQELLDEQYRVFAEVAAAYFAAMDRDALLEVARTNEFEYAQHLERIERLKDAGEAKNLDILRARLDLAQAKEATVKAAKDVQTAGADLVCALGLDGSRAVREDILARPEQALSYAMQGFAATDYPVAEAFAFARTNAPAMRIVRARLRSASAEVDRAIADLKPEVSASLSFSWTDPAAYFRWGVNAVESLFEGWRKTTAVERATVALKAAAAEVDRAEQELSLKLELAIAERDTAREALRTAAESLRQAKANLEQVSEQYELGEANRVDYTDAVSDYVTALGHTVTAFYTRQTAEAALFQLVGRKPVYAERKIVKEEK